MAFKLATAQDFGFTTFRGRVSCVCLADWIPALEALADRRGIIDGRVRILQLTGSNKKSAGTHKRGGTFDVADFTPEFVALAREMGAPATWQRFFVHDDGRPNHHIHGVLNGCPHNQPSRYQLTEQLQGRDGLATEGRDPHPDPTVYRTWRQGITWAQQQVDVHVLHAAQIEEEDMPISDEDLAKISHAVRKAVWEFPGTVTIATPAAPSKQQTIWQSLMEVTWKARDIMPRLRSFEMRSGTWNEDQAATLAGLEEAVRQLAQMQGLPLDLDAVRKAAHDGAQDALTRVGAASNTPTRLPNVDPPPMIGNEGEGDVTED